LGTRILGCSRNHIRLGTENSKAPAKIIRQAKEALKWAVKNRIARCKEDFEKKYQDPKRRAEVLEKSKEYHYSEYHGFQGDGFEQRECPACGATGVVSGYLWIEEISEVVDPDDPTTEWVDRTYVVDEFSCPSCTLNLLGTDEIRASGLPDEFKKSEVRERDFEPPYMNE
jgi:hypothetical protein